MDDDGFRLPQYPPEPPQYRVKQETDREIQVTKTVPAPDSRYSAFAAPLEDGRLLTDYRQACVTRAPPGLQFGTKQWIVHNADQIIEISRKRQAESTGHVLGTAGTEIPSVLTQQCSPASCSILPTTTPNGIGIERTDIAPELFGTFTFPVTAAILRNNKTHLDLNKERLYGRNTVSRWTTPYS